MVNPCLSLSVPQLASGVLCCVASQLNGLNFIGRQTHTARVGVEMQLGTMGSNKYVSVLHSNAVNYDTNNIT